MATNIFFIRHGESEGNKRGIIQGHLDKYGLTIAGKKQIIESSKYISTISNISNATIISSPLKRATETSEIIKKSCDITKDVIYDTDFKEIYFGHLEGITKIERDTSYKRQYEILKKNGYDYSIFEGESIDLVRKRAYKVVDKILKIDCENLIIVSHGGFLRELIKCFISTDIEELAFENGCVYLLKPFIFIDKLN